MENKHFRRLLRRPRWSRIPAKPRPKCDWDFTRPRSPMTRQQPHWIRSSDYPRSGAERKGKGEKGTCLGWPRCAPHWTGRPRIRRGSPGLGPAAPRLLSSPWRRARGGGAGSTLDWLGFRRGRPQESRDPRRLKRRHAVGEGTSGSRVAGLRWRRWGSQWLLLLPPSGESSDGYAGPFCFLEMLWTSSPIPLLFLAVNSEELSSRHDLWTMSPWSEPGMWVRLGASCNGAIVFDRSTKVSNSETRHQFLLAVACGSRKNNSWVYCGAADHNLHFPWGKCEAVITSIPDLPRHRLGSGEHSIYTGETTIN